jgi:predicted transposase/invertase (TIGR01784 family)
MRYLDPKNDLTFKKIFGEHPRLLKSFLNALLPLDTPIEKIEYLQAEMIPVIPIFKNSIVDVRCYDEKGKQFIVEMQMLWTDSFKSRVLFNASKAFVKQIEKSEEYKALQPVYSLCIVNEIFEPNLKEHFHHYKIVHTQHNDKLIPGLEFIFIELPKFKAQKILEKKLSVLWLRFLSEIKDDEEEISNDFFEVLEIKEAIELLKESSFTKNQLETYDKYWDTIRTEKTLILDAFDEGKIEAKIEIAKSLKNMGISIDVIIKSTGLSKEEINIL